MEQSVVEMEYDTKKAPLGKITTEQVLIDLYFVRISSFVEGPGTDLYKVEVSLVE